MSTPVGLGDHFTPEGPILNLGAKSWVLVVGSADHRWSQDTRQELRKHPGLPPPLTYGARGATLNHSIMSAS